MHNKLFPCELLNDVILQIKGKCIVLHQCSTCTVSHSSNELSAHLKVQYSDAKCVLSASFVTSCGIASEYRVIFTMATSARESDKLNW